MDTVWKETDGMDVLLPAPTLRRVFLRVAERITWSENDIDTQDRLTLTTTVHPAARAGPTFRVIIAEATRSKGLHTARSKIKTDTHGSSMALG